jgi:hypothetical protein
MFRHEIGQPIEFAHVHCHGCQVENRDREIQRLHRMLDGGRSVDTLSFESRLKSNEKLIGHQNAQVSCSMNVRTRRVVRSIH